MGTQYPLSYLRGAAVVLDAAPAATSLRNGQVPVASEADGSADGKLVAAIPRPKKRLIGRGPVDFISIEMPPAPSQAGGGAPSSSALHDSVMDDDYSLSKLAEAVPEDDKVEAKEKRSILMIGSLRVDLSSFESILRVRSGCYLLPQAGARAIVVVLEIPPKRPRIVEGLGGEDDEYVLIESTSSDDGEAETHPAIEGFERCLKRFLNLVTMENDASRRSSSAGSHSQDSSQEEGDLNGTSLRACDQNHLIKFANSIFAECDHMLVNTSTKQGVTPVVASSIKVTGNILCKTLLTTSNVAGSGIKVFGRALREVMPPSDEEGHVKISESTLRNIEQAEWLGEKAVNASEFVVSNTSKAIQYTGKVVSDKILQSNLSKYWAGLDGTGAEQSSFFQTMGILLDAMVTSAVDLQLAVQKSTWSLLNDLKDTAIDLVDHKYGADAAAATGKSVSAALNVGSATVSAATVARSASGLAKGVAKESSDQIVSMETWMGGSLQMYGVFESKGTTRWSQVWGLLRPDALALYSQSDLVQERPTWIVTIRNISEVATEDLAPSDTEEDGDGKNGEEEEEEGEMNGRSRENGNENGGVGESPGIGDWGESVDKGKGKRKVVEKQCKVHLSTRSHGSWSLRFESQESGRRWCEALLRCIRSNPRCKLLGCKIDGKDL